MLCKYIVMSYLAEVEAILIYILHFRYYLPSDYGYIRHFRHCRKSKYSNCMNQTERIVDNKMAEWSMSFRDNVIKVRKAVFGN